MKTSVTTSATRPLDRSRHWHGAIAGAYFPLDLKFRNPERFSGDLTIWQFGDVSISRLSSDGLRYLRLPHHFRAARKEEFLVTVPMRSEVYFSQCGSEVRCAPGGFFLERSHEPYEFSHDEPAELWVLKVESQPLAERIRGPDRFCSLQFEAQNGAGGLFTDMLHLLPGRFDTMNAESRVAVGRQLIDLLVLAIKADDRVLGSGQSSVRNAHLARIEAYVRANLRDARLDPDRVARACGNQSHVEQAAVDFIWVAVPERTTWRYGERGYRYLHLDAGHVCQNLYLAAWSIGCGTCAIGAYDDHALNGVLELDGEAQFVIYMGSVGKRPGA